MQPMMTVTDPTAVVGKRVGAAIVDVVLMTIITLIAVFAFMDFETIDAGPFAGCPEYYSGVCFTSGDTIWISDGSGQGLVNLINLVVGGAIYWWWQGTTGKTPGKVLLGIRTVNAQGQAPGVLAAFLRQILWIVDLAPWCIPGLVGLITASSSKGHRRVGDMVASTYVVDATWFGNPVPVAGATAVAPGGWATPATPPPGAAPAPGMPAAPPVASPPPAATPPAETPAPAQDDPSQPRWDPERNAYIAWDATAQRWQQYDDGAGEWRPI